MVGTTRVYFASVRCDELLRLGKDLSVEALNNNT